jgi:hypothetical protein
MSTPAQMQRLLLGPGSIAMSTAAKSANESPLPLLEALLLVVVYAAASRVPARRPNARCLLWGGCLAVAAVAAVAAAAGRCGR